MGQHHQFRCEACGYEAEVSGGEDCGFSVVTQTITCTKCKELVDVVVSERPGDPKIPRLPLRCPRAKKVKHPVQPWTAGGPCPRCGTKMRDEGLRVLWD